MTGIDGRSVRRAAGAAAAVALLLWVCLRLVGRLAWPVDDFVAYWAAGRLQFTGGDPYSAAQLFPLQKAQGWPEEIAQMVWNPPSASSSWSPSPFLPSAPAAASGSPSTWRCCTAAGRCSRAPGRYSS